MRTILKPLVSVIGGEAAVRAANLAAILLIARVYGVSVLGVYAACIAVITVAVMFADNGLQTSAIAEVSAPSPNRGAVIGRLYISKTILVLALLPVLWGISTAMRLSVFVGTIGAWVALRTILQSYSQLQMSILKAVSKASTIGVIQSVHSAFLLMGIGLVSQRRWVIFALLAWLTIGQFLELLLASMALWRSSVRPAWPHPMDFWASMKKSTPLGITFGLANLIVRLDTIVLSAIVSLGELGGFSAANTILAVFYVASWLFGTVVLPVMVRLLGRPKDLRLYVNNWALWIALISAPCALLAFGLAPKLMGVLYGPGLSKSGVLASIMALACPFILLNSLYTNLAIATNARSLYIGVYVATAIVTVALDIGFGRAFGAAGVAGAIVIREFAMLAGFWLLMPRTFSASAPLDCPVSS